MKNFINLSKLLTLLFFIFFFGTANAQRFNNFDTGYIKLIPKFYTTLFYNDPVYGRTDADGTLTIYDNSYCACVDLNTDVMNAAQGTEDIATTRDGVDLSIEMRPLIVASDTQFIMMQHMKTQHYEWQFDIKNSFDPGITAVLVDSYLDTHTPVSMNSETIAGFDVDTNDPGSVAPHRFYIVFTPDSPLPVTITGIKAYPFNTGVNVGWGVSQQINMAGYEIQRATNPGNFTTIGTVLAAATTGQVDYNFFDPNPAIGTNYYKIKARDVNGVLTYSNTVKVTIGGMPPAITVYPNPVTGNTFTLQLINVPAGNYTIILTNSFGQVVYTSAISYPGGSGSQLININTRLAPGLYMLKMGSLTTRIIKQ